MYNVGICDDEKSTCWDLEKMLYGYAEKCKIDLEVTIWNSGEELCADLRSERARPDLLFLDIELITTDGIRTGNFIRNGLGNVEMDIVYISCKSSYAMSLFKIQPLDFLLKPLKKEAVTEVLERSIRFGKIKNQIFEYFSKGYYFRIPYKEILYFYSRNKKIALVTMGEEKEFGGRLKEIEKKLPTNFIPIHQSYLINLDYIRECTYELVRMCDGSLLTISRPYRKSVREQITQYKWEKINYHV